MIHHPHNQNGFALLYTVIVVSLILTIAISISNIAYKQTVLSTLAKDSQIAFYQADAGIECGLYWDIVLAQFPLGTTPITAPETITCGNVEMGLVSAESADDYLLYHLKVWAAADPCFTVVFDKATNPAVSSIEARGHNVCAPGPRQVERALDVRY